ncbi:DUF927 domain-containing protein [Acinetobacter junii]|uniref:DUF927 domain-containing protein n=1 Tax=Acinetobacter junii TaxID=40215 RepID=UPI003FA1DFE3
MNIKPSWDTTPQKQQSPLEEVGNDASDSIIEALEEYTVSLFNNNPLHGAMVKMMGGCPVEIRRSVIENATQYGESDDNALYGLAVFDLYNEHLQPTGAVFTNPTIEGFKDIVFGHGGVYFNRSKLNKLPLIVTDDIHLAFKTTYPVYAPYSDSKIKAYPLKTLLKAHPDLCVIAPVHQQDDIQRRYTDLSVILAFIPEPPNLAMSQDELDSMIQVAVEQAKAPPKGHLAKPFKYGDGVFHLLENGLYYIEQTKEDEYKQYISSPIHVLAQTRDSSSNAWGRLLEWHDADGVKHTQALSMEFFQSDGVELRKDLANQGVVIAPSGKARNLLQSYLMSYPTAKRALCVERAGWHDDVYVLPNKQIGQHKNSDLVVYQTTQGVESSYQNKGTLEQWQNNISMPIASHSKLVVAMCSAFAGQLLTPLEQQTGAGIHFKGQSSKGKTTALYVACSVWGNPERHHKTWRSTGNALEHTAYSYNDSFLGLDEIGEISNPKELGNIVYMLANGKGKARLTKQITARAPYKWKLIFMSTGEKSLKEIMQESGQKTKLGQEVRLIDIDVDQSEYGLFDQIDFAEDGAKQSRQLVERSNQFYGVAGMVWLDYLTSNKDKVMVQAKQLLEQYNLELIADIQQGHISRVANTFALLAVAGELATQAGITGWKAGTAFDAVKTVFNTWVNGFEYVGDYQNREYILAVKAFLEAYESSRFEAITPDIESIEKIINRVGYWKIEKGEKLFIVLPEQFKNEVCKGHDSKKVANALLIEKLLEHDTGKTSKTVRVPARKNALKAYVVKEAIFSWE